MDHGAISLAAQERQQTPHVPVGQAQTPSCFGLFQTAFPHLLQHFQSLPLAHTQADSLLFHRVPRPLENAIISTLHNPDILILRRQRDSETSETRC
jgi:hypothetical protein